MAQPDYANPINDELSLLMAEDDSCTNAVQSWAKPLDRCQVHYAVHIAQQINNFRIYIETQNTQTGHALAKQFYQEYKNLEQQRE
jgi:hypothetical protein